ncbi:MAG: MGMT family protein [Proteobacteria bacterium]|nr:MGMT family protein [Pseudomonadota bacterium]MCH9026013.1 MGMT family protein [Pseudomonadota bacterium]
MSAAGKKRVQRIRDVVARIPLGKVASYGMVADLAGYPRHARFVGRALGESSDGRSVPWHRVINAQGRIAFPRDSECFAEQSQRLSREGVTVVAGSVDMTEFSWQPSLDEMLWGPDPVAF